MYVSCKFGFVYFDTVLRILYYFYEYYTIIILCMYHVSLVLFISIQFYEYYTYV